VQNTIALEHERLVNVIDGNFIMDFIPNFKLSKKQLELLDETIIKMISIIQDTLSVEVPTWYNNKTFVNISENKKQEILNKIKL